MSEKEKIQIFIDGGNLELIEKTVGLKTPICGIF